MDMGAVFSMSQCEWDMSKALKQQSVSMEAAVRLSQAFHNAEHCWLI